MLEEVMPAFRVSNFKELIGKGLSALLVGVMYQLTFAQGRRNKLCMYPRFHIPTVMKWKKRFLSLKTTEDREEWIEKETDEGALREEVRSLYLLTHQRISFAITFSMPRLSVPLLRLIKRVWPHRRSLQQRQGCQCA